MNQQDIQQVKALIQSSQQYSDAKNRYTLSPINGHNHDGINSPTAFQPILTYVGAIGSDGTVLLLPQGWTVVKDGGLSGTYYVTHNLGGSDTANATRLTAFYSCVANAIQSTNIFAVPVISAFTNEVDFVWGDIATGTKADTGFNFALTVVNNKKTSVPAYYGTYVS